MYRVIDSVRVQREGSTYILESLLEGHVIELDPEHFLEFDALVANSCATIKTELQKFLHEQNMLLSKEEECTLIRSLYEHANHETLRATIMPTEQCNFRCVYCYEKFENAKMEEETLAAVLQFLENELLSGKFAYFVFDWFGGEPTLVDPSVITEINQRLKTICVQKNIVFRFSMTTNGYLLSRDRFIAYVDSGIQIYQITLDGSHHDQTRKTASGGGSYEQIISNLLSISELDPAVNFQIILRHNILAGDFNTSWYADLARKFRKDRRFTVLLRAVSDLGGERIKKLKIASYDEWVEQLKVHSAAVQSVGLALHNERENRAFSQLCYAGATHAYIFRSNGDIVKCSSHIDEPINRIGFVDPKRGVYIDEEKNSLWYDSELGENCHVCEEKLACYNKRCPYLRLKYGGRYCCFKEIGNN